MLPPMRLLITSEEDSKEFQKILIIKYLEDQIQRFKHAKEIYQKHKHEF